MHSPLRHPKHGGSILRASLLTTFFVLATTSAMAHAVRPAYMDLSEEQPGRYALTLRLPDPTEPGPLPVLPEGCEGIKPPLVREEATGPMMRLEFGCDDGGLGGRVLAFTEFPPGCREVLVHYRPLDGPVHAAVVPRGTPELKLPASGEGGGVPAGEYLGIGVEHILLGADHLLFVLGLLLVVGLGRKPAEAYPIRRLLGTVTAFTLAHSITLSLAVLGHARLPGAPVELVISLSILLLAVELSHPSTRQAPTLTLRYPWAVAFLFGLLHGFGFAGALADIGFPDDAMAMALLMFNVGVEVGQIAFIGLIFIGGLALRRLPLSRTPALRRVAIYAMGSMAAFWCWDRFWGILAG